MRQRARFRSLTPLSWGIILTVLLCSCAGEPARQSGDFGYQEYEDPPQPAAEPEKAEPVPPSPPEPEKEPVRIALRDDVPSQYTVEKGDTLWDIASLFLKDPWLWPEIWYFNPQINNPHLIYPGDVLTLIYVDGKPQLRLSRDGEATPVQPGEAAPRGLETVKLSPRVREESLEQAIPTIPTADIKPFLNKPRIVTKEELETAPYIVSSLDQHLATATGDTIYARGLDYTDEVRYNIFRPGRTFRDPESGEILGYEATMVSEAKLVERGDPATLTITRSMRETLNGDRILPADEGRIDYYFTPHPPDTQLEGQVVALVDAISQSAQRQIVVINLGEREGIDVGTVLAVDQAGETVRDRYARSGSRTVKLPDTRAGLLMVFRVFDRLSYGLIVDSTRAIHANDFVRTPTSSADIVSR